MQEPTCIVWANLQLSHLSRYSSRAGGRARRSDEEELMRAVMAGKLEDVRQLIEAGLDEGLLPF
jgi:hypothetical protein